MLFEHYNINDNSAIGGIGGATFFGQTFRVINSYKITKVRFRLVRQGSPGVLRAIIYKAPNDYPAIPILASGEIDGNSITTNSLGDWYDIPILPAYVFDAATKYNIVLQALSGNESNFIRCRADENVGYSGLSSVSLSSGNNWSPIGYSFMFEVYGEYNIISPFPSFQ